jgi:Domain of unknown function (DUF4926)
MREKIHLLDVVSLTQDVLERGLVRGQVGTAVEVLGDDVFEVGSAITSVEPPLSLP